MAGHAAPRRARHRGRGDPLLRPRHRRVRGHSLVRRQTPRRDADHAARDLHRLQRGRCRPRDGGGPVDPAAGARPSPCCCSCGRGGRGPSDDRRRRLARPGRPRRSRHRAACGSRSPRSASPRASSSAIMGPSGAGKTSLLEAISGLVRLDEGHVDLDGIRLSGPRQHTPPSRRAIGLLGQDATAVPAHDRGREHRVRRPGRRSHQGRVHPARGRVAGPHRPRRVRHPPPRRALRRTAPAHRPRPSLAASPRLLLLDEPFTSLDVEAAAQLREVVREQRGATTTILVSHGILDAQALAERLVIVQAGRIVQDAAVAEVLASPATPFRRGRRRFSTLTSQSEPDTTHPRAISRRWRSSRVRAAGMRGR